MGWEMGGGFIREGIYVYPRLIHADEWQRPTRYCKAIILKLKKICIYIDHVLRKISVKPCKEMTQHKKKSISIGNQISILS